MPIAPRDRDFSETNVYGLEKEYGVFLANGRARRFETVVATSRDRAADMCAIRCGDDWQPIAVTISERWEVAGRCVNCNRWLLLPDDEPVETAAGPACRAC